MDLYLIGNGFDCHHNLKTQYLNFKEYVNKINPKLVKNIDELFNGNIPEYAGKSEDIEKFIKKDAQIVNFYCNKIEHLHYTFNN